MPYNAIQAARSIGVPTSVAFFDSTVTVQAFQNPSDANAQVTSTKALKAIDGDPNTCVDDATRRLTLSLLPSVDVVAVRTVGPRGRRKTCETQCVRK